MGSSTPAWNLVPTIPELAQIDHDIPATSVVASEPAAGGNLDRLKIDGPMAFYQVAADLGLPHMILDKYSRQMCP